MVAVAEREIPAVKSDEVKPVPLLPRVDETKFYMVTLQFGQNQSWAPNNRIYKGQKRKRVPTGPGEFSFVHDPVVVSPEESFTGSIVNGLIQKHNEWIEKHRTREQFGQPDFQLLVLDVVETDQIPVSQQRAMANGLVPIHLIESVARKIFEDLTPSKSSSSRKS